MIKFFRKIRFDLMDKGKTSKYLKYALGEILLVVIGILIALQINNWNEQRKERQRETAILKQIHRDFKNNKVQLDSIILNNQQAIAACDKIIQLMPFKKERSVIDSFIKYSPQILRIKTFNPTNGTVEALISSSTFNVIQNDSLRNLLVSWTDVYKDYREEEQYARDLQIWQIQPYFRKNVNFINPYDERNLELLNTPEMHSIWIDKRFSVLDIQAAIRDEKVELYVNEIIRLTQPND